MKAPLHCYEHGNLKPCRTCDRANLRLGAFFFALPIAVLAATFWLGWLFGHH